MKNKTDTPAVAILVLFLAGVSLLVSPFGLVLWAWLLVAKITHQPLKWDWLIFGFGLVLAVITHGQWSQLFPVEAMKAIFSGQAQTFQYGQAWRAFNGFGFGLTVMFVGLSRPALWSVDPDRVLLKQDQNRQEQREREQLGKRLNAPTGGHSLVLGVSGAGKTAGLLADIQQSLANNEFLVLVDGKGDVADKYGMYRAAKVLSKRHNRPFYAVSATTEPLTDYDGQTVKTKPYNPFDGIKSPDTLADIISQMVDLKAQGGAQHYQAQFEAMALQIAKLMLASEMPINFNNVILMFKPGLFKKTAQEVVKKGQPDLAESALEVLDEIDKKDLNGTFQRLNKQFAGAGQKVLNSKEAFNLTTAYHEKAVVIVLLDTFVQESFSRTLAQLFVADVKGLVSKRMRRTLDKEQAVRLILDEFAVYGSRSILDIENKARSAGVWVTISTQSFADFDSIEGDDKLRRQVIDNTSFMYFYRVNDPNSAEDVASIVGTQKSVTQTNRSDLDGLSGDSSNTVTNEFKVPVDDFKELANNHGILYNKQTGKVVRFKNKFVKM